MKLEIKAVANEKKRTFTIRKLQKGSVFLKYRTIRLSKEEFESCKNNTQNDWEQFLKTDAYYRV